MLMRLSFTTSLLLMSVLSWANFPPQNVIAVSVHAVDTQHHELVTGTIRAVQTAALATRESSHIASVLVNEGDYVRAGEKLLKLDDRRLQANIDRVKAQLAQVKSIVKQRQADLVNRKADVKAFNYTAERQAISDRERRFAQTDHDIAFAALAEAQQQVDQLKAELTLLSIRLEDTELSAPFDGVITRRLAEPGEWFNQGQLALEMTGIDQLEAWLEVPERFVSEMSSLKNNQVTLDINEQQVFSQQIKPVLQVNQAARTFNIIVTFDNQQHQFMPGMSVDAWVATGKKQKVIQLSKNALLRRNGNNIVYKVIDTEQGQTSLPIPVQVLFQEQSHIAIALNQGISEGDIVIVEGNERLMPGPIAAKIKSTADTGLAKQDIMP